MVPRRHIIRKASLEVDAGAVDAFGFQQEAVAWAQDQLMRELDGIFASLPDDGSHVILDRLDIRVEASDPAQWRAEILPRLRTELAAVLASAMRGDGSGPGAERLAPAAGFFRKLAHYLEHGVLPWNLMAAGRADLIGQMEEWLAWEESRDSARELAVLWKRPPVRNRFLQAFPPESVCRLLVRLFRMPAPLMTAWSRDAARIAARITLLTDPPSPRPPASGVSAGPPSLPVPLLQEALSALSHDPGLFGHGLEEEIVHAYLGRALLGIPYDQESWFSVPCESAAFRSSLDRLLRLRRQPPQAIARPQAPEEAPIGIVPGTVPGAAPGTPAPEDRNAPEPAAASHAKRARREPAAEGLFIPNAGLILLAPFFGMLFQRLGLVAPTDKEAPEDKKGLRDPGAAIALLHFLATGQEGPAEFEVPLAKVLCGFPLEATPALPMALAPESKSEALQLLASALDHWSALKGTSPEGLREAFLQRPGKLTRRQEGDWLLQVEQKPYDMLLQQLPWSFQLIRLPWMEHILRAEWVE